MCFPVVQADETAINPLKDVDMNDVKAILILSHDDWSKLPEGVRVLDCTDLRNSNLIVGRGWR